MTTNFYSKTEIKDGLQEVAKSLSDSKKMILSVKYLFDHTHMTEDTCDDNLIVGFEGLKHVSKNYKNAVQKYRDINGIACDTQQDQENVSLDLNKLARNVGAIRADAIAVLENTKKGIDSIPYDKSNFESRVSTILTQIDADIHSLATKHAHLKNLNTQKNDELFDNSQLIAIYDNLHSADQHRNEASWILNSSTVSASSVKLELAECAWQIERARTSIEALEKTIFTPIDKIAQEKSVNL